MRNRFSFLIIPLLILSGIQLCSGADLARITTTGPSWNTFTNRDGTGLYHEIIQNIFPPLEIRVTHNYTNANRGIRLVNKGLADIYLCRTYSDEFPTLMLGKYQMYEGKFYAIFKKNRIKKWNGQESLAQKKVVWRRGYYKPSEFKTDFKVFETDSGTSAISQIILGRGDFYIDDLNLIRESVSKSRLSVNMDEYNIKPVGKRTYHPAFKKSVRGDRLIKIYERGMKQLHDSGRLKIIYNKWDHPYPEFSFSDPD